MISYVVSFMAFMIGMNLCAQTTPVSQMERLGRGGVAVIGEHGGYFVSWRLLGTDTKGVTFDLYRKNKVIAKGLADVTSFEDRKGKKDDWYRVVTHQDNGSVETSDTIWPWNDLCLRIHLDRPQGGECEGRGGQMRRYEYSPNDCSVGDVNGDGEYEIILKWDPSNAADNSFRGAFTGNVYIDCYSLKGEKLWRIDLGKNIRAGAHYTQFMVYDFDGDGRSEVICKTAPGTIDGTGRFVSEAADDTSIRVTDNSAVYVNREGHILSGPEFLTVFDGLTGKAQHTIYYKPDRAGGSSGNAKMPDSEFWGDDYGNRSERYLAAVAFLDGPDSLPSAVMCRGYYTRSYLWAVGYSNGKLHHKWLHASVSPDSVYVEDANHNVRGYEYLTNTSGTHHSHTAFGQGSHSIAVADVDGDGKDEIMYGSAAIDDDGSLLYSTGLGHGDAHHLGDLDPDRPGLEMYMVLEEFPHGYSLRDAATGELIRYETRRKDTGRGLAADILQQYRGYEFWDIFSDSVYNVTQGAVANKRPSVNFRIYWDGDLQDELFNSNNQRERDGHVMMGMGRRSMPSIRKIVAEDNGSQYPTLTEKTILFCGKELADIHNSSSCNGTKATPNLSADLFGDWREEIILWDADDCAHLNIFSTNIPTQYRIPTLMHDHVYRMSVAWQNVAYNQPPHLGYFLDDFKAAANDNHLNGQK